MNTHHNTKAGGNKITLKTTLVWRITWYSLYILI